MNGALDRWITLVYSIGSQKVGRGSQNSFLIRYLSNDEISTQYLMKTVKLSNYKLNMNFFKFDLSQEQIICSLKYLIRIKTCS